MAYFTIPDQDESAYPDQSRWYETDILTLTEAIAGDGVLTGCAVTAQGTPDMTVAIAAGELQIDGSKVPVAAGNVTVTSAHATLKRIDLVLVNTAGVKSVLAGTPAAYPKPADLPASSVPLAAILVIEADTAIEANQITDKRVRIVPPIAQGRLVVAGTNHYVIPGAVLISTSTQALVANQQRYFPFIVSTAIAIDQIAAEVTVVGAGGTLARLGIYHADKDGQPGNLVIDAGTIAVDSLGVKTLTVNVTLQPGRYLFAANTNGAPTFRAYRAGAATVNTALGATPLLSFLRSNTTYGTFASPGPAIAVAGFGGTPMEHIMALRITTP